MTFLQMIFAFIMSASLALFVGLAVARHYVGEGNGARVVKLGVCIAVVIGLVCTAVLYVIERFDLIILLP